MAIFGVALLWLGGIRGLGAILEYGGIVDVILIIDLGKLFGLGELVSSWHCRKSFSRSNILVRSCDCQQVVIVRLRAGHLCDCHQVIVA